MHEAWVVPAAHALLYGLVRCFVGALFSSEQPWALTDEQKKLMRERARHLFVTTDFGRRYKCIVQYR